MSQQPSLVQVHLNRMIKLNLVKQLTNFFLPEKRLQNFTDKNLPFWRRIKVTNFKFCTFGPLNPVYVVGDKSVNAGIVGITAVHPKRNDPILRERSKGILSIRFFNQYFLRIFRTRAWTAYPSTMQMRGPPESAWQASLIDNSCRNDDNPLI